jgi:hypothetical protein
MVATRTAFSREVRRHAVAAGIGHEAALYLAVIDSFRAEGCEPHWRSEASSSFRLLEPPERRTSC